jgi:Glycosyltransferase family 87
MSVEQQASANKRVKLRSLYLPSASALYRFWRSRGDVQGSPLRDNGLRLALGLWVLLAAAISVRTVVRPTSHTVFPIFVASAEHWWGNQSLYDLYPPLDNFRYPPIFALFMTPFSALGRCAGGILWSWVSIVVYVAGLWCFARDVIPAAWTWRRTALFLALGALGALRGLWNAQSNALIVGLLLLGTAALVRALNQEGWPDAGRRWWLAALLLAVPVCLKLTPLAPVLLLCALCPRRLAWRLVVTMTALFLIPFLTRPPAVVLDHYRDWFDHIAQSGNSRWLGFRDGWTVWLVLRHLISGQSGPLPLREPMDSAWYRLVQIATATAALIWCLWQQRRSVRLGMNPRWLVHVTLSMGLAWLMLFGPAVEHATYVFLAAPLAWGVLERRAWPHGRGLILAAFVLIMILGWGVVTRLLSSTLPMLLAALPAGTALFALWLLGYAQAAAADGSQPMANTSVGSSLHPSPPPLNPSLTTVY